MNMQRSGLVRQYVDESLKLLSNSIVHFLPINKSSIDLLLNMELFDLLRPHPT